MCNWVSHAQQRWEVLVLGKVRECRREADVAELTAKQSLTVQSTLFISRRQVMHCISPAIPLIDQTPICLHGCGSSCFHVQLLYILYTVLEYDAKIADETVVTCVACPMVCFSLSQAEFRYA